MMRLTIIFSIALSVLLLAMPGMTLPDELRCSPVSYHLSFDDTLFFKEDFIEQSGKKSLVDRKIDFPAGKFGKGIRMSLIPSPPDDDNMSGIDLDLITAVIFNTRPGNTMGYNEPFIWGSGRCNPRLGAVAFWVYGDPPFACPLFEQTSIAFGRLERDLLGITIDDKKTISAYLRDARYNRHKISSTTVWNGSRWNHVVLNWDWAQGLELWVNGEKIASSWGNDGWFETMLPGLFHLPAPGLTYDEVYMFDRPLSKGEITTLMTNNRTPPDEPPLYKRSTYDEARCAAYAGADDISKLPVATPKSGLSITEVWPIDASDGYIPGWHVIDGRNELAWPHEYAFFTIIPGDADFHAEKVDIPTPTTEVVNYVTITGNLTGVRVQTGSSGENNWKDIFNVPEGKRFFYGSIMPAIMGATFRIPFTEKYGAPPGFEGDVYLPVSGEKRIQNVGLYYVKQQVNLLKGKVYTINMSDGQLDKRYHTAFHALTSRDERKIALLSPEVSTTKGESVSIGAFSRLSIMSEPFNESTGVTSITLTLPLKTAHPEEALFVRVHDPAVPSRLWNELAVNLKGFNKGFGTLILTIDFQDIVLTGGDRLWIDLGTNGYSDILVGNKAKQSTLSIETVPVYIAVDDYARKEIISSKAQYTKMYEFMPWQFTKKWVNLDDPYCFGGPFDIIMPALAIHRVKPNHFVANYMIRMSGPDFKDGHRVDPSSATLITLPNPNGAPEWALYMRDYNRKRHAIADWWVKRQNPDGQIGGGWNDDTLFMSFHMADLPLDGNMNAKAIIDTVHTKFEKTKIFSKGYCEIRPIDRMHTGDFISERYNTIVNNLGQAYAAEREMKSAWHFIHPEQTPYNYSNGIPFRSSKNVFNWYWGEDMPQEPYISKPLADLAKEFRLYASILDDYYFYRMTKSYVHTDDYTPYGSYAMYEYLLGGARGARWDAHLKLAVMWPSGGGPDVERVVLRADDTTLSVACYSFDDVRRDLVMRPCRLHDGQYRVAVLSDPKGEGKAGEILWETTRTVRRFDTVTLPIPPLTPCLIRLEMIEQNDRPKELPDLAIDPWDVNCEGTTVTATVHNLGNAPATKTVVRLKQGGNTIQEIPLDFLGAPTDFVAQWTKVTFSHVPISRDLRVAVDPDNTIPEILEENNSAQVR